MLFSRASISCLWMILYPAIATVILDPTPLLAQAQCNDSNPSRNFWIPQFGHGVVPNTGGILLLTETLVINLAENTSEFRIESYDENGNPAAMLGDGESGTPARTNLNRQVAGLGTATITSRTAPVPLSMCRY